MLCVPRKSVSKVLHEAHDLRIGGHFGLATTLSRLDGFHWRHKVRDTKRYVQGCVSCMQNKDSRQKTFGIPNPLEIPDIIWGSLATDVFTQFPMSKEGFDCITT